MGRGPEGRRGSELESHLAPWSGFGFVFVFVFGFGFGFGLEWRASTMGSVLIEPLTWLRLGLGLGFNQG